MRSPGAQKGIAWLLMAAGGILALALASRSGAQAEVSKALGWAVLAATAFSLLLQAVGRRIVAVLVALLALGTALASVRGEGHWGLLVAGAFGLVGALVQLVCAPRWPSRAARYDREAPKGPPTSDVDIWKALDAGQDPTTGKFGDSLATRETSHVPSNQEDQ